MTTEQKFLAAVNVIKSLPRDGPFQPSYDLTLKFQAYYKQATDGPCNTPKPSFFDRGKYEWNAWKDLGDMPKEVAMEKYVEQLSKVIETMSYTDAVSKFIDLMGPFYEIVWPEDMSGESGDDSRQHRASGLHSHDEETEHSINEAVIPKVNTDNVQESFEIISHQSLTETVSLERFAVSYRKERVMPSEPVAADSHDIAESIEPSDALPISLSECTVPATEVLPMLLNLQQSLESILRHLDKLEELARAQNMKIKKDKDNGTETKKRTLTPLTMLLVVLWPFIVHWVVYVFRRRRKTAH